MARGGVMMCGDALLLVALLAVLGGTEGSYRFGTLSWRVMHNAQQPNTVEFELVTAWRRTFQWVYVKQVNQESRKLTDHPIVGDVLRVTGLYDSGGFADQSSQAVDGGTSEIMFFPGDGSKYFVDMTVTSYSESENWIMSTTLIHHTYATPYQGKKQNEYPLGFSYEAGSQGQLDANQPFSHIPWTASFVGCCRADLPTLPAQGGNANKPYRLETTVDLTDRDNAPASRTLPIVTVSTSESGAVPPFFWVVAKDQFMPSSDAPPSMSASNTNYPVQPAKAFAGLTYKRAEAADLGLAPAHYSAFGGFQVDLKGRATFETPTPGFYQVAVVISSGSTKTIVDFMVRVVERNGMPMALENDLKAMVDGWVGFQVGVPTAVKLVVQDPQQDKLVLNYIFAGLNVVASSISTDASGMNTGLTYSPMELNHQGLPVGAFLYSTDPEGIIDVRISFDNPFEAHRPGHNAAVNKIQRDYTNAPRAADLWAAGYRPINITGATGLNANALSNTLFKQAFNLNSGTGGAAVYMWILRGDNEPAVTEMMVSTSRDQERMAAESGFTRIPQNLNEQSSSVTSIYLWIKKGSGRAITDVHLRDIAVQGQCCTTGLRMYSNEVGMACPACPGDYHLVPANLNHGSPNRIFMYVNYSAPGSVSKMLSWVPQVPGHYLMCYSGKETDTKERLASTPRCIDMDVRPDPAPKFLVLSELSTHMGKKLHFKIAFVDIPHPDEKLEIAMDMTGLMLAGARFNSSNPEVAVGAMWEWSRMVEWFPDASYGGFSGEVCFEAKDAAGPHRVQQMSRGCVRIHVERCKWWVQTEDTLVQVAARFQTNWLQIWHLNPTIYHPDNALPPGNLINSGHLYEVRVFVDSALGVV